jgi:hypothetical protein
MRTATVIVALFDIAVWLFVAVATFLSGSDPATRGLDDTAGLATTVLLLATGLPALLLALADLAPRFALILALAFPVVGVLLLARTVAVFA